MRRSTIAMSFSSWWGPAALAFLCLAVVEAAGSKELRGASAGARHAGMFVAEPLEVSPAQAVAEVAPRPAVKTAIRVAEAIEPISTAMKCIMGLAVQYLVVHTALAVCRMANDSYGIKYTDSPMHRILVNAVSTVAYAPMLAVLILACHIHVRWLSYGADLPLWIQVCCVVCEWSVLAMTLCACGIPLFSGEVEGEAKSVIEPKKNSCYVTCFTATKLIVMYILYGCVACMIYGTATYKSTTDMKSKFVGQLPPTCPTIWCTIVLSCLFFVLQAVVQSAHAFTHLRGGAQTKFEQVMSLASQTMEAAPMVAVLFIATGLRIWQMDPINGYPQLWVQKCIYLCTVAVAVQTVLSMIAALMMQSENQEPEAGETRSRGTITFFIVARYAVMVCLYAGVISIIISTFTIEHPQGIEHTLPQSTTMKCMINLTLQFFCVYFAMLVCTTTKEFTGQEWPLMTQWVEKARSTVALCPMLSMLFLVTRVRGLQMTKNKGIPQAWIEDGMYMATGAVLIQFLISMVVTLCAEPNRPTGVNGEAGQGSGSAAPASGKEFSPIVPWIGWIGFAFLYTGVFTVVIGLFIMAPNLQPDAPKFYLDSADVVQE